MGDTPLGNVIAIRSENDPETIKGFTKEQRAVRREWQRRTAKAEESSGATHESSMDALFAMAKA